MVYGEIPQDLSSAALPEQFADVPALLTEMTASETATGPAVWQGVVVLAAGTP